MNRLDHDSQRINNVFFGVVLAAAAACTAWIATGNATDVVRVGAAAPSVQLERVVIVGHREAATPVAATIELPRVVITAKRDAATRIARDANRELNG